jgi:AraC family transcriptional regulator of adaptative response/methylated-DNA-[protein]-cysteine methyltransferase
MGPPEIQERTREMLILSYAVSNTALGKLLVAVTERGLRLVTLGDSTREVKKYLRSKYPNAKLESKPSSSARNKNLVLSMDKIKDYLANGTDLKNSRIPLDLKGTAFQRKVWKELQQIPYGSVRSYSEIASRIGLSKATRAVGNACASNWVSLVIPCHRVVPKTGRIGNYELGVERKRKLLEKEGVELKEPGSEDRSM